MNRNFMKCPDCGGFTNRRWSRKNPIRRYRRNAESYGDCFEAAANYMQMEHSSDPDCGLILVHAEVTSPDGTKHGHAFVLKPGNEPPTGNVTLAQIEAYRPSIVIDVSKQARALDPEGGPLKQQKEVYYYYGQIGDNLHEYTFEEMNRKLVEYRHYGPWDLETEHDGPPPPIRYRRNAGNTTSKLYWSLLENNHVPEHMDALNIILVLGRLRPATLIGRGWGVKGPIGIPRSLTDYLSKIPDLNYIWINDQLLVFNRQYQSLVRSWLRNQNDTLFGRILGYYCPGEVGGEYKIAFISKNPFTQTENPFMGYTCDRMDEEMRSSIVSEGSKYKDFLSYNEIGLGVKLRIEREGSSKPYYDEWL